MGTEDSVSNLHVRINLFEVVIVVKYSFDIFEWGRKRRRAFH